jgi:hypothetical protein
VQRGARTKIKEVIQIPDEPAAATTPKTFYGKKSRTVAQVHKSAGI